MRGMEQRDYVFHFTRCLRWAGGNWVGCEEEGEAERKKTGGEGVDRAKREAVD